MLLTLILSPKSKSSGFTLIEVMIVVAIIGILAMIVVPTYNEQIRKTRRADAKILLMTSAQQLEKCFSRTNTFAVNADPNLGCNNFVGDTSENGHYTISAAVQSATQFALTATPAGTSPQTDDVKCAQFSIDNTGNRLAKDSDDADATDTCWQ